MQYDVVEQKCANIGCERSCHCCNVGSSMQSRLQLTAVNIFLYVMFVFLDLLLIPSSAC